MHGVGNGKLSINMKIVISVVAFLVVALVFGTLISNNKPKSIENNELVHEQKWGIYVLDLENREIELIYSSANMISRIRLNNAGDRLVFSQDFDNSTEFLIEGSPEKIYEEICSIRIDGEDFKRITNNNLWDLIPNWSADDSSIFFLSFVETLDIFRMDANGDKIEVYDSGYHDNDLHCSGGKLVFTRNSQIWIMNEDKTELIQVTDPPRAGEWGDSVLPFGDYDPNLDPNRNRIVFERLINDKTTHGNYNIYIINVEDTEEIAVTDTGYSQGLPIWSHSGEQIVFAVGAIGNEGKYDMYIMNSIGSENKNITPEYFPTDFLCHHPIFSKDDKKSFSLENGTWIKPVTNVTLLKVFMNNCIYSISN
ncbi:TolB family protein [Thermoproteota archaeon]